MSLAIIFRYILPLTILFVAILVYRKLWTKVIKPALDKEKKDDVQPKSNE